MIFDLNCFKTKNTFIFFAYLLIFIHIYIWGVLFFSIYSIAYLRDTNYLCVGSYILSTTSLIFSHNFYLFFPMHCQTAFKTCPSKQYDFPIYRLVFFTDSILYLKFQGFFFCLSISVQLPFYLQHFSFIHVDLTSVEDVKEFSKF